MLLGLTEGQLEGLQDRAPSWVGCAVLLRVQRPGFQGLLKSLGLLLLLPIQSPSLYRFPVRFDCRVRQLFCCSVRGLLMWLQARGLMHGLCKRILGP